MKFEVLAHTTEPNGFGKYEYILGFDHGQAWTAKAGDPLPIGTMLELYGDAGSSTLYMGVNWARHGFEAAIPHRPQPRYVEPEHVPRHWLCIHMFHDKRDGNYSLSMLRVEAERREEIPEIVKQHGAMFHNPFDRYEIKDLGII